MENLESKYHKLLNENRQLREKLNLLKNKQGIERALNTQRLFGHLIIREENEEQLLKSICDLAMKEIGYKLAWIGFAMKDKTVVPVASAGLDKNYLTNIKITWSDDEYSQGPTGQAIKTSTCVVMQDIINNPKFLPWKEAALRNGFQSSAAIPLLYDNKIFGALNIYSDEKNAFNEEEINILTLAANDLAIGISNIRRKKEIQLKSIELQNAKEKAEENEAKFRAITNQSTEGITVADMDGNYYFVNPAFCEMSGYSEEELLNLTVFDMKAKSQTSKSFHKSKKEMEGIPIRVKLQRKDKIEYLTEVVGKIIEINNQKLVLGTVRDITERVKKEKELIIAKEKAEESNRLKTEFINNMSHEIRTPMNGILGFSKLLDGSHLSVEKRKNYIDIIQHSGDQLLRVIDDIMEISKLGTKQIKSQYGKVCLNDLLLKLFLIFDVKAKENATPLYLNKGLYDRKSTVFTDALKVNKILSNLLENALKFTDTGFIEFGYQLIDDKIRFYVKDSGIGIKADKHEIIFERFSHEEKKSSGKIGGLGLGLAIAKANAELIGGKISLESEKGKGATFFVTIPYKPVYNDTKPINTGYDKGEKVKKPDKYTILIVEDEEVNYLYIETLLEDENELECAVLHAKNGYEAVDICKGNADIDFVLMDLKMPIMNGYEATKLIKEFRPDLPIVAQTAYTTTEDEENAKSAGCDDFISKPIKGKMLNSLIDRYLIVRNAS